ncbi:MAG: phosphoribosylanthranilate isomerase [Pirellulales bacterium]|nr:phosphoribosylanthranilate isomerase [Pirellulales bacterium]
MFRIKICGVTNTDDGRLAAEAGADAIGLNFYSPSPRSVTPERAAEIADSMPDGVLRVGVFVNATLDEIESICDRVTLDAIQLHGDEPPEFLAALTRLPVVRAFRLGEEGPDHIHTYLAECQELDCSPRLVLIDSHQVGQFGGTGATADWNAVADLGAMLAERAIVLAGGLTPDNVAEAIDTVHPAAVDTASGVEREPGHKDPLRVRAFVERAKGAYRRLDDDLV